MTIEQILEEIVRLCQNHSLFGSRAKETYRERSDIDIAVAGASEFEELREEIDGLPTLYTVDLVNLDECNNQMLLEDIESYGREIYKAI